MMHPDAQPARRPRSPLRRILDVVVPLGFAVALAVFVWDQRTTLAAAGDAPIAAIVGIATLFAVAHFLNSTEFWLLYTATGARLGAFENWMLFTAGQLANHLPGQLGSLYRLRYMRVVHGVPYLSSAAVYGANLVITIAGASVAGLFGVIGAATMAGAPLSVSMLLVFTVLALLAAAVAVTPLTAFEGRTGIVARLWQGVYAGLSQIRARPRTALLAAAIESVKYLATAWRLQITFALIGVDGSFWLFLVLAPAAGIASFIAFTPAALGFREVFVAAAAAAMGLNLASGLLGATVDRAVMLATFLVLGGMGFLVTLPTLRAAARVEDAEPAAVEVKDGSGG